MLFIELRVILGGGASSDHIIEETLMQSLKSTGSVTRGKGIEEIQCNIYNLSPPACAQYINRRTHRNKTYF